MPPSRGVPGGRVGGGTRGTGREQFILLPLAPDHSGLTMQEQPTLYWYISRPTTLPIEFTLTEAQATAPEIEVRLPTVDKAGFQHVSLADQRVRLKSGVAYRWFVAVVSDPQRRSKDILAGGAIERIETSAAVSSMVAGLDKLEAAARMAQNGIWYDALQLLSEAIAAEPTNADARRLRQLLLSQVGFGDLDQQ